MMKLRDKIWKPFLHFPIIQTLAHLVFASELRLVKLDKENIEEENKQLAKNLVYEAQYLYKENQISELHDDRMINLSPSTASDLQEKSFSEQYHDQEKYKTDIKSLSEQYHDANQFEKQIFAHVQEFKIFEAFLEGAPQSILQFVILLKEDKISGDWYTWFTIFVSFLTFSKTTAEIFLQHPTHVIMK